MNADRFHWRRWFSARLRDGLGQRLPLWLAVQTFTGLALVSLAVYLLTAADLEQRQTDALHDKAQQLERVIADSLAERAPGAALPPPSLQRRLEEFFDLHRELRLRLAPPGQTPWFNNLGDGFGNRVDEEDGNTALTASGLRVHRFRPSLPGSAAADATADAVLVLDARRDAAFVRRLGMTLMAASLAGALLVSAGGFVLVRLALSPVRRLVQQTRALAAETLHERLEADGLPDELLPLVDQFNALLERLRRSYAQLEGFNADVAHELRTPLATLIASTELALRQPGLPARTVDHLESNLEELRRMTGIVNDMLFLSHAHSGVVARRQAVPSLAALAKDVAEYHEAAVAEADLHLRIEGEATGDFDAALLKRALSNLIGNATRYALPGSTIRICIETGASAGGPGWVRLCVANEGAPIADEHLPRLFDRFYRADPSRSRGRDNHGLGLSIVAAIARMHGGAPFARSDPADGPRPALTRIGFTLTGGALPPPPPLPAPRVRRRHRPRRFRFRLRA